MQPSQRSQSSGENHPASPGSPDPGRGNLDLSNTEVAFAYQSDEALRKAARIFGLMNKHWLVGIGSKLGVAAVRMHLPFVKEIVKRTIYEQFCGGTTLLESKETIDKLYGRGVFTVLDYGAEGKESEQDFNHTMNQTIRAIEFAGQQRSVAMVSTKVTGMARFGLLEKVSSGEALSPEEKREYSNVVKRMESVAYNAREHGVSILFDAEETWIQPAINDLVEKIMREYNEERAVAYHTYQMYCTHNLDYLRQSYARAEAEGYVLGAKLVRGAYMEKERERAAEHGYPSPIHPDKAATDAAYDEAVRFCVDHFENLASINASHNTQSNKLQADLIEARGLPKDHEHFMFCQLLGMSDNITFNLAQAGYRASKYMPYGPVADVVPYLIRRAQENTSVTGDMSREYKLVLREMKRRGLA